MDIRRSSPALSEAEADALLSGRALAGHDDLREIIGLMRTASAVPAPTPSAALAVILTDGFDPLPVTSAAHASRWGRWSVRLAAATAAAMTVTLGAATANALPAPFQTAVADVVGAVTPLQLPRPAARPEHGSTEGDGPGEQPAGVPDSGADADTGDQESTAEPAEVAPTASATKAPAVGAPPRRPGTTATDPDESGEHDTDQPDSDEPAAEESDAGEPTGEQSETDRPDSDQPDAPEADESAPGDYDLPAADEPELDVDAQPEQDDTDGDD